MFAIHDDNILLRLIMVIVKIIFRYFIEIADTDDFSSTGTPLVKFNKNKNIHSAGIVLACTVNKVARLCFRFTQLVPGRGNGMTELVSFGQDNSSVTLNIQYDWGLNSTDEIWGRGLHGATGSEQEAYNGVLTSCDRTFNFLLRFDCLDNTQ